MEQKPVAWMWLQNGKPVNAFLHDPDVSDEYWQKKQYSKRPLFTADQLKAEREKAIAEVEAKYASIANGVEVRTNRTIEMMAEPFIKAAREKAIRDCILDMEPDFNEEQIKSIVDSLLSTNESKENEVNG